MSILSTEDTAKLIQRKLGLVVFPATLGDANGVVYDDPVARNGLVRVRYTTAAGLSLPPVVRMRATLPPNPGTSVLVGYDKQGELAVLEGDYTGMLVQGVNPLVMNAADPNVYGTINQTSIVTALSHAIATPNVVSTDVAVRAWIYLEDDVWHYFPGERVALSSFIPSSGTHVLVGLYLKTDDTIETFDSTPRDLLDPLGITDVQEIHDQATAGSKPIWFWRLYGGLTNILDKDSFLDGRQFINSVLNSSASGGSLVDANTYIIDDGDNTKRIQFQVSPVTAGQTRTITVKDVDLTLVGEDTVQALTAKTDISIRDDSAQPTLLIEAHTNNLSTQVPFLNFKAARASEADMAQDEAIGRIFFTGRANSAYTNMAAIVAQHSGLSTQSHGDLSLYATSGGGTLIEMLRLSGFTTSVVFNENSGDIDFRIESDGLTHAFFVDAGANAIGINQSSIAATALLDIASTTKGILIPRMTTAQRDAIATPADGLMVYDTDVDALSQYQNGAWSYYVNLSATQTLSNKTFIDNVTTFQDNGDNTKKLQFQLSGITTATTRTLTAPDADTTIVGTDATQTLTNKTLTAPTIADFTNANHDHLDADDGGTLSAAAIASGTLIHERGGLEADVSAFAGFVKISSGATSAVARPLSYALLRDEKAQNTDGGGFTSGAWQTRTLNTESSDVDSIVSLSSNQFTPIAGTYRIYATAPGHHVNEHQARLRNVTAGSTTITGTAEFSSSGTNVPTCSIVAGVFTANGTDAYELQHQCVTTQATNGFGIGANLTTEVYSQVILMKEN